MSSLDNAMKAGGKPPANALALSVAQGTGESSGGINSALQQFGFELKKATAKLRSDHPETTERIDALAPAVDPFPELQTGKDAIAAPLKAALQERRTAELAEAECRSKVKAEQIVERMFKKK